MYRLYKAASLPVPEEPLPQPQEPCQLQGSRHVGLPLRLQIGLQGEEQGRRLTVLSSAQFLGQRQEPCQHGGVQPAEKGP